MALREPRGVEGLQKRGRDAAAVVGREKALFLYPGPICPLSLAGTCAGSWYSASPAQFTSEQAVSQWQIACSDWLLGPAPASLSRIRRPQRDSQLSNWSGHEIIQPPCGSCGTLGCPGCKYSGLARDSHSLHSFVCSWWTSHAFPFGRIRRRLTTTDDEHKLGNCKALIDCSSAYVLTGERNFVFIIATTVKSVGYSSKRYR